MHDNSKPPLGLFIAISFISCVFTFLGQSTRPTLADGAIVSQPVSYSSLDAISSPSGSMARILAEPCMAEVRMGTCHPSQDRAGTPMAERATASRPAVTCSPAATTVSYSRAS